MKSDNLIESKIIKHFIFWILYYCAFSLVWAKNGNYYDSFLLEFLLLPLRIAAVYITLYAILPNSLLKEKYLKFTVQYISLLIICGLGQRIIIYFYYEPNNIIVWKELLVVNAIIRSLILINTTVVLLASVKIFSLYLKQKKETKILQEKLIITNNTNLVEIKADKRIYRISPNEILFIEGLGNYITYNLSDGKRLVSYSSLKETLMYLPQSFVRVHKSYIVNKAHIRSYSPEDLEINNKVLPISKSLSKEVIAKLR